MYLIRYFSSPSAPTADVPSWQTKQSHRFSFTNGIAIGRYVMMPDHVHFFCAPANGKTGTLSGFMQQWKQWTAKRILREGSGPDMIQAPVWQAQFFDHVVRSQESCLKKWEYVRDNPVRAGLVPQADSWPWQGEIYS